MANHGNYSNYQTGKTLKTRTLFVFLVFSEGTRFRRKSFKASFVVADAHPVMGAVKVFECRVQGAL